MFIEVKAINTKSGYGRYIPFDSDIALILEDLRLLVPPNERVFPISVYALRSCFEKIRLLAGLSYLRFHDLRHEAISRIHEMGLTLPEIQSISGHRELSMLQRYSPFIFAYTLSYVFVVTAFTPKLLSGSLTGRVGKP